MSEVKDIIDDSMAQLKSAYVEVFMKKEFIYKTITLSNIGGAIYKLQRTVELFDGEDSLEKP